MAWTDPMTFRDGRPLTAAQLNTHLRDNLLETAVAKASVPGSYFVTESPHSLIELTTGFAGITASDTTTSSAYGDLENSVGPEVTVETGSVALVIVTARLVGTGTTGTVRVSHEISGATETEPFDRHSLRVEGTSDIQGSFVILRTDLTPGDNTFTMKYRVTTGTGTFSNRQIIVIPGIGA